MSLKDTFWGMKPNKRLVIQLAKRQLSELVYDAVNLEGVNMTLPEVQTLLEGITVGGHKLSDQEMAVNQAKAWKKVFELIESDSWEFSKKTALVITISPVTMKLYHGGSFEMVMLRLQVLNIYLLIIRSSLSYFLK
jgi:hypothetical protein